jgi:hypothetical protein
MAWDVQGTNRYTSMCTNLDPRPVSLLTLPDWQVTYAEGRPLKALLDRFAAERHDDTDDSVWIRRASAAQLQERIA